MGVASSQGSRSQSEVTNLVRMQPEVLPQRMCPNSPRSMCPPRLTLRPEVTPVLRTAAQGRVLVNNTDPVPKGKTGGYILVFTCARVRFSRAVHSR